jgi:hypothetical protein
MSPVPKPILFSFLMFRQPPSPNGLRQKKKAADVDIQRVFKFFSGNRFKGCQGSGRGIIDPYVNPAEFMKHEIHESYGLLDIGQVNNFGDARFGNSLATDLFEGFGQLRASPSTDCDPVALLTELLRDGQAYTAAAAGNGTNR